ncbi:MAG: DUF1285 domain-containing protein [Thermodesulfobacteriota bacterium]|nr:DUF1285 domain-containing protein [Thermodesulfobacteriota bacterium]
MTVSGSDIPPCLIFIAKDGRWYHKGAEMIHRDFIRLFYKNMKIDSTGQYVIDWNGTLCFVEVEDTAFVIWGIEYQEKTEEKGACFLIRLSDDTQEELAPETLSVAEDNVMYCMVKENSFPARFNRPAYYQLAEYIQQEKGVYYLPISGKKYPILMRREKTRPS